MIRMQTPWRRRCGCCPSSTTTKPTSGPLTTPMPGRTVAVNTGVAVLAGQLESITKSAVCGTARLILRISGGVTIGSLALDCTHPTR
jgi:hypothetical protein